MLLYVGLKNESWDSQTIRMKSGEEKRKVRRKNKSKGETETLYTWSGGKEERDRKRRPGRGKEGGETERKHRETFTSWEER